MPKEPLRRETRWQYITCFQWETNTSNGQGYLHDMFHDGENSFEGTVK